VRGRDECGLCSVRTSDNERVVLDLLPDYLRTAHAHGKDSYAALGAHLPAVSDASDGEEGGRLGLLDAWVLLLQGESSPRRHGARDSAVPLHAV
jgi:hypothetical protein